LSYIQLTGKLFNINVTFDLCGKLLALNMRLKRDIKSKELKTNYTIANYKLHFVYFIRFNIVKYSLIK